MRREGETCLSSRDLTCVLGGKSILKCGRRVGGTGGKRHVQTDLERMDICFTLEGVRQTGECGRSTDLLEVVHVSLVGQETDVATT